MRISADRHVVYIHVERGADVRAVAELMILYHKEGLRIVGSVFPHTDIRRVQAYCSCIYDSFRGDDEPDVIVYTYPFPPALLHVTFFLANAVLGYGEPVNVPRKDAFPPGPAQPSCLLRETNRIEAQKSETLGIL